MSHMLPQLDVSTYPTQILWTLLAFFALYVLVTWIFAPRIAGAIKRRRAEMSSRSRRARELRSKALEGRDRYLNHQEHLQNLYDQVVDDRVQDLQGRLSEENAAFHRRIQDRVSAQRKLSEKALSDYHSGLYDEQVISISKKLIFNVTGMDPDGKELSQILHRRRNGAK